MRQLVADLPELVVVMRTDGTVLFVNNELGGRLDRQLDEVVDVALGRLCAPRCHAMLAGLINDVLHGKCDRTEEIVLLTRDGNELNARMRMSLGVWDGQPALFAVARESTDHSTQTRPLHDHLRFLETLLDTIPNPVFFKDRDGRYLGCNEAFAERVLGLRKGDIIGRRLHELPHAIPKDLADVYRAHDEDLFALPGEQAYESQVEHSDGTRRDVVFHKATFKDAHGDVAGIVGVMIDVTEHRQIERELRQHRDHLDDLVAQRTAELAAANARLQAEVAERKRTEAALRRDRNLFAAGPVIVLKRVNAPTWPVDYVSANINQFGYRPEDLMNGAVTYHELIHPEDVSRVVAELEAHTRIGRSSFEQDYRIVRADGEIRWVYDFTVVVRDCEGRITHFDGYLLDITERKRIERALRDSQQCFKAIADYTCDWESWIGPDGRLLWLNPATERLTGYTVAECRAMPDYPLPIVHEDDRSRLRSLINGGSQSRSGGEVPFRFRHREGRVLWGALSYEPIYDDDGRCLGHRISVRDITPHVEDDSEHEDMVQTLQRVRHETQQLGRLLPICSVCKKVRDDQGYWEHHAAHVHSGSDAVFSHGICPDCRSQLYPDER